MSNGSANGGEGTSEYRFLVKEDVILDEDIASHGNVLESHSLRSARTILDASLLARVDVRPPVIHGVGLFACEKIRRGGFIGGGGGANDRDGENDSATDVVDMMLNAQFTEEEDVEGRDRRADMVRMISGGIVTRVNSANGD